MDNNKIAYVVERMTLADMPEVAALEQMVFSMPWSRHAFEYELQNNPMAYFAVLRRRRDAVLGQEKTLHPLRKVNKQTQRPLLRQSLLGYAGFWLLLDEAHICTLAVHPEWRGQGLGQLLLVHLIDHATEADAAVMTLEVRASNHVAQNLYAKYGFSRAGLRKGYYSDNGEDAVIMTTERISSAAYQACLQALKAALWQRLAAADGSSCAHRE